MWFSRPVGQLSSSVVAVYFFGSAMTVPQCERPFLSFTSSPCSSDSVFSIRGSRCWGSAWPTAICAFSGLARTGRPDNFVDCSGHSGTWLSRNSRCIQNQFHYSCRLGHARLCHFLRDAGARRVAAFFLTFLKPHAPIMISRWKPCSPLSHSCEICGRFPSVVLTAISATAFQNNRLPWRLS